MTIEFKPPLTIENIESQLSEILKQEPLPKLTNEALEKLWKNVESTYHEEAVPYALIFFSANMPPLKPDPLYEKMIESTIKNKTTFDILYNEINLKTILKILSTDVNLEYKEKCLSALLERKEDIATKKNTLIEVWTKIRDETANDTSKIEFFYSCILKLIDPLVKQNILMKFKESQERVFEKTMPDYVKNLLSKNNLTEKLNRLLVIKSSYAIPILFNRLGAIINDEDMPFNQRFDIFKSIFEVFTTHYSRPLTDELRNLYPGIFVFIQKNWNNDFLNHFLEENKIGFSTFLSELESNPIYDPLFAIINNPHYQEMLKKISPKLNEMYEKMRVELDALVLLKLSDFHKENLIIFSEMIFPEKIENEPTAEIIPSLDVVKEIIYNQAGYDEGETFPESNLFKKGNPLTLPDNTPIGYNFFLPKKTIKGVFVKVYGGGSRDNKKAYMERPQELTLMERHLLKEGIAVVTLNLADLIESTKYQLELPKEIEDKNQASIHQFYDTLKNHPEKLHPNLQLPANIPYCLFGRSFGGRTVIKHAEKYPHTYDRIISYDGALSYDMLQKSDLSFFTRGFTDEETEKAKKYLDAMLDIESINDDILLIHNVNDNNTNLKSTLAWYEEAQKTGKQDKVRLYIADKGNTSFTKNDRAATGHFPSDGQISFNHLMGVIFNHIQFGSASMPEIADWRALKYDILANKNYRSANTEEKFISLAYRIRKLGIKDEHYKEKCENLYYILDYLNTIPSDVQKRDIQALRDANLLTNDVITNAVGSYLEQFFQFFKEVEKIQIPDKTIANIAKNQKIHDKFSDVLNNPPNDDALRFALFSLYQTNPKLLEFHVSKCQKDPVVQTNLDNAFKKVEEKITEEDKRIANVWLKTIQEVRNRIKLKRKGTFAEQKVKVKGKKPYVPGPKRKKVKKKK